MKITKTLIFDFDGTMIDSMPMWREQEQLYLERNGVKCPKSITDITTPLGYEGMARYFISLGVKATVEEVLRDIYDFALDGYNNYIPAKPTVIDTLKVLKEQGYSLNVLTASQHCMIDGCLERLGMTYLFDNIWSSDEFSLEKKNPEIYRAAAKRLGTTVDMCTFFDDNAIAIGAAVESGMRVIGVYDSTAERLTDEIKSTAHDYIYQFSEILEKM